MNVGGLFSDELAQAPWSWAKVWDLVKHLPLPAVILALAGTAQLIRIMRANLLDELRKPYVVSARARGLSERRVILKYPVRVALNPFASTVGYLLPYVVSGSIIVSLVLSLPTVGPLLLRALIAQDMFLAGTIVLLLGVMTVVGTFISDLAPDVDRSAHPPGGPEIAGLEEERVSVATQWQLMWWRFRRHKLAMVGTVIVLLFYMVVALRPVPGLCRPVGLRGAALAPAPAAHSLVRRRALVAPTSTAWSASGTRRRSSACTRRIRR